MFSYLSFFIVPVEYAPWSVAAQTGVGSTTRYRKSAVNCPLHSRKDQKTELGHGWRRLPCLKQECSLESQEYSGRLLLSTSLQGSWAHEQTKTGSFASGRRGISRLTVGLIWEKLSPVQQLSPRSWGLFTEQSLLEVQEGCGLVYKGVGWPVLKRQHLLRCYSPGYHARGGT